MSQHDIPIRNTVIIHPDCRETFLGGKPEEGLRRHAFALAGISEFRTAYRIAREGELYHIVFVTISGQGRVRIPGKSFPVTGGDIFVVPAGTPHEYRLDSLSWSACWFHLEPAQAWVEVGDFRVERGNIEEAGRLQVLMEDYVAEAGGVDALSSRAAAALADLVVVRLERLIRPQADLDPVSRRIADVWDLASRSPSRQWSIAELASTAGRSERQFHRDTLRLFSRTPGDYLVRLRIDRAADYLRTTDYSLAVIAELVGFKNPYSLSNTYKRLRGRRPSQDRKRR